jgi:50S ribosomal protein L16 3-hydroxylase
VLGRIRWSRVDVTDFLGRYLSAPKPHVVFRGSRARGDVVQLDRKTQLLYFGARFFINGESFSTRYPRPLRELADRRAARLERLAPVADLIAEWQAAGYVHLTMKTVHPATKARADG